MAGAKAFLNRLLHALSFPLPRHESLDICLDRCFHNGRTFHAVLVSVFRNSPVDDLPDSIHVSALVVLVLYRFYISWGSRIRDSCCPAAYLEVVGVLPHVDTKDWDVRSGDRVLVLGGSDVKLAIGSVAD